MSLFYTWLAIGIILLVVELMTSTYLSLILGAAALIVSAFAFAVPESDMTIQIILFIVLSAALSFIWYWFLQPKLRSNKFNKQIKNKDYIGYEGYLTTLVSEQEQQYKTRFSLPVMDVQDWVVILSDSSIAVRIGDRVRIDSVELVEDNDVKIIVSSIES